MDRPFNLVEIEMVIKAHCHAQYRPERSQASGDALDRLLRLDILKFNSDHETVTTTLRGQFWLNHLLTIPYPVESYRIPEALP